MGEGVFSLVLMAFHRSRTMKLSSGVSVCFTHTKCSLAPKEVLMLVVTCQSLLKTVYTPCWSPELIEEHGFHDGHEGDLDLTIVLQR